MFALTGLKRVFVYLLLTATSLFIIFINRSLDMSTQKAAFVIEPYKDPSLELYTAKRTLRNRNVSTGFVFDMHRLRLWYAGKCLDSTDEENLSAEFCDPDVEQVM